MDTIEKLKNAANSSDTLSVKPMLSLGTNYTLMNLLFDGSSSMRNIIADTGKSAHQLCVESLERFLEGLRGKLGTRLIVSVYIFGGSVKCIVKNTLLCDLNTEALKKAIPQPSSLTPMGQALSQAIRDTEAYRDEMRAQGYRFNQPIYSLLTDGEATDSMEEANKMADERLSHKPRQRMVLIPIGIGNTKTFPTLERLIQQDPFRSEIRVLNSGDDFTEYVRIINATTVAISGGETFNGIAGMMGNASLFTGQ